jgi:hypothetical protein
VALLAGCSGNTYGTGVSSEKQLVDDLGNLVTLDLNKKRKSIDYASRPGLVKPPVVAQLPTPAEKVQSESAYFPEDPEVKRRRLLEELAESDGANGEVSPELQHLRLESLARSKSREDYFAVKYPNLPRNNDGECEKCEYYERIEQDKQRKGQKVAAATQPKVYKRRYLTEPPTEYQAPAETAEVGVMGEDELSEAALAKLKRAKKEKSIFERIFGG